MPAGFSLKRGTAAPLRRVKPANKVGAVNYKEPVTYMYVQAYRSTIVYTVHFYTVIESYLRHTTRRARSLLHNSLT